MRNRSTVVREHTKNEKAKDDKDEESKKQKMQKTMTDRFFANGRHHLGINDLGIFCKNGFRTKRLSVLIGNHQLIGAARIERAAVLKGDHRALGSHRSLDSEE